MAIELSCPTCTRGEVKIRPTAAAPRRDPTPHRGGAPQEHCKGACWASTQQAVMAIELSRPTCTRAEAKIRPTAAASRREPTPHRGGAPQEHCKALLVKRSRPTRCPSPSAPPKRRRRARPNEGQGFGGTEPTRPAYTAGVQEKSLPHDAHQVRVECWDGSPTDDDDKSARTAIIKCARFLPVTRFDTNDRFKKSTRPHAAVHNDGLGVWLLQGRKSK